MDGVVTVVDALSLSASVSVSLCLCLSDSLSDSLPLSLSTVVTSEDWFSRLKKKSLSRLSSKKEEEEGKIKISKYLVFVFHLFHLARYIYIIVFHI